MPTSMYVSLVPEELHMVRANNGIASNTCIYGLKDVAIIGEPCTPEKDLAMQSILLLDRVKAQVYVPQCHQGINYTIILTRAPLLMFLIAIHVAL